VLTSFFRILMVRIRARAAILFLLLPYAGCALAQSAPGFPSRPWHAAEEQRVEADARNFHDSRFNIDPTKTYSLAELLDLAEAHNPETRVAWERARAQPAALGVEHSEVYPTLAAVVLSGTGRSNVLFGKSSSPRPFRTLRSGSISTTPSSSSAPGLVELTRRGQNCWRLISYSTTHIATSSTK
jgi:outer membrane protein TolC